MFLLGCQLSGLDIWGREWNEELERIARKDNWAGTKGIQTESTATGEDHVHEERTQVAISV